MSEVRCRLRHSATSQPYPLPSSHNLPQQLTSFIGRAPEIEGTARLLKSARLLTLLGMGGVGKTRLALRLAADTLRAYPDGAWFRDLAPIGDSSLVPSEAAQVLGVQEEPARSLTQTLCAHLRDRTALIILDNCEHLIAACATFANSAILVRMLQGGARCVAASDAGGMQVRRGGTVKAQKRARI